MPKMDERGSRVSLKPKNAVTHGLAKLSNSHLEETRESPHVCSLIGRALFQKENRNYDHRVKSNIRRGTLDYLLLTLSPSR